MPPGGPGGPGGHYLSDEEKANRPKVTSALVKRVFSYLSPYWKQMALVLLLITFSSTLSILPSVITGKIIDDGLIGRMYGIVSQETYLFNGSIRDNLLYAKPDATEEDLIEACKKANIYDFIQDQENGFDTMVGNRGLKLSGGEKQRISIARVLLKDPALLIFDEATSALDSISEKKIQDAIDPLISSRTSILIAHRLSTILAADQIVVLKDGEIVERGKHEVLVGAGGVYTELYETQFSKAIMPK